MEKCLGSYGDDSKGFAAIRSFFKNHVVNVSDALIWIYKLAGEEIAASETPEHTSSVILSTNSIIIVSAH